MWNFLLCRPNFFGVISVATTQVGDVDKNRFPQTRLSARTAKTLISAQQFGVNPSRCLREVIHFCWHALTMRKLGTVCVVRRRE